MAEYKTPTEIRNYPLSNGETADLIALIKNNRPGTWVRAESVADAPVGTVAYVSAMGAMRRGVVVKVTKTKVHVALTTQGAVDSAAAFDSYHGYAGGSQPIRVQIVVAEPGTIFIAPRQDEPVGTGTTDVIDLIKLAEATEQSQIAYEQAEAWLERHVEQGTEKKSWSLVEDARQADHAEALEIENARRAPTSINPDDLPDPDGSNNLPIPFGPWGFGVKEEDDLTLDSQAGKVDSMNNDATTQTPDTTRETTGSAVVQLLEKVWSRIRENHPELPAVVIVTGAGLTFGGGKWGHFRANGWTAKVAEEGAATSAKMDEMFMAGETLAKGARQVLQTMLHEGAHTLAKVREVQDTSRQGRWHNAKFKSLAFEMGLEYNHDSADKSIGFSQVTLREATVEEYADLLADLDREIHLMVSLPGFLAGLGGEQGGENMGKAPKGPAQPNTNNVKATCLCEEPNIVRMSRKVLDRQVVHCEDCNSLFEDRG